MNAPDWIAEARAEAQARPWMTWAHAAKVPVHAILDTLDDAALAFVTHLSLQDAVNAVVNGEIVSEGADKRSALVLLRAVAHLLRDRGATKPVIVDAIDRAYRAHGIELLDHA